MVFKQHLHFILLVFSCSYFQPIQTSFSAYLSFADLTFHCLVEHDFFLTISKPSWKIECTLSRESPPHR